MLENFAITQITRMQKTRYFWIEKPEKKKRNSMSSRFDDKKDKESASK